MRIIPAIDLINGNCVRLTEGDYNTQKIYAENPTQIAQQFEKEGAEYLHLVDLDGAKKGEVVNWHILENIAKNTTLSIDFSGGIKTEKEIEKAFQLGAKQVVLGSIAIKNPTQTKQWIEKFGNEKIILSADVKQEKIAINGWQTITEWHIIDFLDEFIQAGLKYAICTDIEKDGKLSGVSLHLYQTILHTFPTLKLIASGGVHKKNDITELKNNHLDGLIIGKAIYENKINLKEII
jgi:phosphoribosylformimino-5-aminoimidazole carboxamide ribotide isomerase